MSQLSRTSETYTKYFKFDIVIRWISLRRRLEFNYTGRPSRCRGRESQESNGVSPRDSPSGKMAREIGAKTARKDDDGDCGPRARVKRVKECNFPSWQLILFFHPEFWTFQPHNFIKKISQEISTSRRCKTFTERWSNQSDNISELLAFASSL